jgi:hypothetical protein
MFERMHYFVASGHADFEAKPSFVHAAKERKNAIHNSSQRKM